MEKSEYHHSWKIDTPVLDLLANLVRDADTRREELEQKLREADNRAGSYLH
jgi:hypothetical protein